MKYRFGRYLPLTSPVDVALELASICNMKCSYCYHAKKIVPFSLGMMTHDTAQRILDSSWAMGVSSVKLNWKGESTLNPIFPSVAQRAKNKGFIDRISNSNFKFHTHDDDIFCGLSCMTKVKVSLDSFRKEVFETQRIGGDWDLTMANVHRFYNWPRRNNELVIQAVRTKLNKDEDIEYEAKRRWPSCTVSVRDMVAGRVDNDVSALEHRKRDKENRQTCLQAHVRLIFSWDGRAFPCCPDTKEQLCLGDINKQSLSEIFNSHHARTLRKNLVSKRAFDLYDACKNCSSFESHKGFKPNYKS